MRTTKHAHKRCARCCAGCIAAIATIARTTGFSLRSMARDRFSRGSRSPAHCSVCVSPLTLALSAADARATAARLRRSRRAATFLCGIASLTLCLSRSRLGSLVCFISWDLHRALPATPTLSLLDHIATLTPTRATPWTNAAKDGSASTTKQRLKNRTDNLANNGAGRLACAAQTWRVDGINISIIVAQVLRALRVCGCAPRSVIRLLAPCPPLTRLMPLAILLMHLYLSPYWRNGHRIEKRGWHEPPLSIVWRTCRTFCIHRYWDG